MSITNSSTVASSQEPITDAIVAAVADAEDEDVLTLPPLWDVIDPEALETLFAPTDRQAGRTGRVTFDYCGYGVTVTAGEGTSISIEAR